MTDRETDFMFAASRGRAEKKPPKTHRNRRQNTEESKVLVPEWTDDRVSDKKKKIYFPNSRMFVQSADKKNNQ